MVFIQKTALALLLIMIIFSSAQAGAADNHAVSNNTIVSTIDLFCSTVVVIDAPYYFDGMTTAEIIQENESSTSLLIIPKNNCMENMQEMQEHFNRAVRWMDSDTEFQANLSQTKKINTKTQDEEPTPPDNVHSWILLATDVVKNTFQALCIKTTKVIRTWASYYNGEWHVKYTSVNSDTPIMGCEVQVPDTSE